MGGETAGRRFNDWLGGVRVLSVTAIMTFASLFVGNEAAAQKPIDLSKPLRICGRFQASEVAASDESMIYVVRGTTLTAIDAGRGTSVWTTELPSRSVRQVTTLSGRVIVLGENASSNWTATSLSKNTGLVEWQITLSEPMTLVSQGDRAMEFLSASAKRVILDPSNGQLLSADIVADKPSKPDDEGALSVMTTGGQVIVGDRRGVLTVRNETQRELWNVRLGGGVSSLLPWKDGVFVASNDNFLYFFDISTGDLEWKRRLGGRATGKPSILGQWIVVGDTGSDSVSILSVRDGKLLNQVLLPENEVVFGSVGLSSELMIVTTNASSYVYRNECK